MIRFLSEEPHLKNPRIPVYLEEQNLEFLWASVKDVDLIGECENCTGDMFLHFRTFGCFKVRMMVAQ